jgi:hypothetical protein
MYVGNVTIVGGLAIASNSLVTLLSTLPLVVFAYAAIVAAEERYLRNKFGTAFDAYCRDVRRWLPNLSAVGKAFADGTFHWRRVIVKEYGTPFGWVNVLCLIAMYNLWKQGMRMHEPVMEGLVAVMGLITLVWLTARTLKKTRRLVAD